MGRGIIRVTGAEPKKRNPPTEPSQSLQTQKPPSSPEPELRVLWTVDFLHPNETERRFCLWIFGTLRSHSRTEGRQTASPPHRTSCPLVPLGKKLKLRDVLSGDMISPPLGDVRHSAHVGPEGEGDMFGDVGFLQGKMDMLPSLSRTQNGHARSHSAERRLDDGFTTQQDSHNYAYDGYQYHHTSTGLLKTTISMPVFVAHEQAPPKPPRLHLDDPSPPSLPPQHNHFHHHQPSTEPGHKQANGFGHALSRCQQHPTLSLCENGMVGRLASEPCRDVSLSPAIRRLMPSSGSFSEASSEDSMSETCGALDVRRGLSLDSDAGLSNEDLRSEGSESPCAALHPNSLKVSSGVSRSESMAGLDLDLGPSILEDVLSIMDRYKTEDDRCEL
ncbi:hypothetical protein Q5P01_009593 [Channa striata]|uniref:CRIB domain-containing protein n=1 Tax=Channa striata TaxID=64152 RepID=A0AA88SQY2_CHASR|nr:hypothetical protein Q5P01_009593 [Channa striata]